MEKIDQVANNARRLLKSLGVNNPDEAADGPGDTEILDALVLMYDENDEAVIDATRSVGCLAKGAADLHRRAKEAADEIAQLGKLTVPKGHQGDIVDEWIAEMMSLYRKLTGKKPATSVGGVN